jgi:hypothetical protein
MPRALDESPAAEIRVVRRVVHNFVRLGRADWLEALFEPRAARIMPGLPEMVTRTLREVGVSLSDDGLPEPIFVLGDRASVDELCAQLHRHPHLSPALEDSPTTPERSNGRLVTPLEPDPERILTLSRAFPRARFLQVVSRRGAVAEGRLDPGLWQGHGLEVDMRDWNADEDRQLRRILAFVGEPWDDALAGEGFEPMGIAHLMIAATATGTTA